MAATKCLPARRGERREREEAAQFTCEVAAADGGGWCVEEKGT
jgi:hypothetical protein